MNRNLILFLYFKFISDGLMELFLMCIIFVYTNLYNISDSFSILKVKGVLKINI